MEGAKVYRFLEEEFVATFMGELIPGIFHNYANPLNGIMGRSNLLQRRLVDFVKKIDDRYPDVAIEIGGDCQKLLSDIRAINNESERFYEMFRASAGKFYAIGNQSVENLNLSKLMEAELAFAEFYLDFKHNVKREVCLEAEVPDVSGITAYYSMAFWMLLRVAMGRLRQENEGTLLVATGHDERSVFVKISGMNAEWISEWGADNAEPPGAHEDVDERTRFRCALSLLRQSGEGILITCEGDTLILSVPYRHPRGEAKA
jgi:signal transduction histidine kinase